MKSGNWQRWQGYLLLLFMAIVLMGCTKGFTLKDTLSTEEAGAVGEGVVNLGTISEKDGWIYYVSKNQLYKRKWDWTERTKVTENQVAAIFISEDMIYYKDKVDQGSIFKMKTDGTETTQITDDQIDSGIVAGDWVYYNLYKDPKVKTSSDSLCKIRTDGSEKTKLADVKLTDKLRVVGDWLYYLSIEETGEKMVPKLYRMKTDGTENKLVTEACNGFYLWEDSLYYLTIGEESKGKEQITICKANADGSESSEVVTLNEVYNLAVDKDWLYYTTGKEMSRIKLDGTGQEKLNQVNIWQLDGVSGDWMYISEYSGKAYRVKLDGSVGTELN